LVRKNRLRKRRALSNVVTTMMLVTGTALLGSALFAWGMANFKNQQNNIGNQLNNEANAAKETLVVEDVWFFTNSTSPFNYANVTVRDTGTTAITVSSIFLNNTKKWSGTNTILPGNLATIAIPDNWGKTKPQNIWIQTKLQTNVKGIWIP